jgi:hypothetical protein
MGPRGERIGEKAGGITQEKRSWKISLLLHLMRIASLIWCIRQVT